MDQIQEAANPISSFKSMIAGDNGIPKSALIRNLVGFWLLGLCNNYAYVIMLSAAHDVLERDQGGDGSSSTNSSGFNPERDCNSISTGAILLANIIPSLVIKLVAPFWLSYTYLQVMFVIFTSTLSFVIVALSSAQWMTFAGVVCASLSSGLGEITLLRYSTGFDKNVVSTWSSGTGASGVLGAFSYAAFTTAGLSPRTTLLIMLVIPVIMFLTFWILLVHPKTLRKLEANMARSENSVNSSGENLVPVLSFKRKIMIMLELIKYTMPLTLVYFAEYFINQGLLELVNIPHTFINHNEQYRWYQVDYQIGVFISRSSVNFFPIKKIWSLGVLQFANVAVISFEAYYLFMPSVWIVFAFVLFEGLLGGSAYVNTFYKITQEIDESEREFSMGAASMGDTLGIMIAGFVAIPVHDFLCRTKIP